ncbi:hypothetical protein Kpol_1025p49 [Vanderwaltozyma polyspora DSM 70294]|uniref:Uncharacterized protein n=1 Tax=Vanderwaltozyma polyspora (strain ATCC 22028 / DSM 70294 / BCRC 21397 / CBS 2163 / NBRC 10782 / NRRL Y-8283 / UCD 57-17) TaxID=436907 RepID=A7TKX3_VANPO|nr:uncharacterized protein Kpol_1025p49 [Vanderwaltozyma polyspora DSM 70294]EDO17128.1 hypothetical protein Kpol_1025p49 [Vanderwaltozyma polyspora DSM 70294]
MKSSKSLSDAERLEKRRLKFSKEASELILNDDLRDVALLSRSSKGNNNTSLQRLKTDQEARWQLWRELEVLAINNDNKSTLEHGLRKLREIIISIYDEFKQDEDFMNFTEKIYIKSYNLFLFSKEFGKLGGIVLNFMMTTNFMTHSSNGLQYKMISVCHASHVDKNLDKSIKMAFQMMKQEPAFEKQLRNIIRLSLIYLESTESPNIWFEILSDFKVTFPLIYQFLIETLSFKEIQTRTLQEVSKCYNQIPLQFLMSHWFHNLISQELIAENYKMEPSPSGIVTVFFKKRKQTA